MSTSAHEIWVVLAHDIEDQGFGRRQVARARAVTWRMTEADARDAAGLLETYVQAMREELRRGTPTQRDYADTSDRWPRFTVEAVSETVDAFVAGLARAVPGGRDVRCNGRCSVQADQTYGDVVRRFVPDWDCPMHGIAASVASSTQADRERESTPRTCAEDPACCRDDSEGLPCTCEPGPGRA